MSIVKTPKLSTLLANSHGVAPSNLRFKCGLIRNLSCASLIRRTEETTEILFKMCYKFWIISYKDICVGYTQCAWIILLNA